jgi:hypothetical protein
LPYINDLLDQSNGANYFIQIDLKSGYYQIYIGDEDVEKTTMIIVYGLYEFLVDALPNSLIDPNESPEWKQRKDKKSGHAP